jgi:hypothetical protein
MVKIISMVGLRVLTKSSDRLKIFEAPVVSGSGFLISAAMAKKANPAI